MKSFIIATVAFLCLAGCKPVDVSGNYDGILTVNRTLTSIDHIDFALKQDGKHITGTMTIKDGPGAQLPLTGLIDKNKITFATEMKEGFYASFEGDVTGNVISGFSEISYFGTRDGTQHDRATFKLTPK